MKATFHGTILAESDNTVLLEGNHYFPAESLNKEHLKESNTKTTCPFKGEASYYDVNIEGYEHTDTGRYYPTPKPGFENIAGHVAFYPVVTIEE